MKAGIVGFVLAVMVGVAPVMASTYGGDAEQYQRQDQDQGQLQAQGQQQSATGNQSVNNPRPYHNAPNVTVQTAPGQSGVGVSFPGGSLTGVKTDAVNQATQFLVLCGSADGLCTAEDKALAVAHARTSLTRCYFLGPIGWAISAIPGVSKIGLDLEGDGSFLCF